MTQSTTLPPKIRPLTTSVINKIAAGEVIERPASAVKELVENSVDAGATQIDVTIESGGAELIRVVDNGHGIPSEDLPLAVASHATSKIVSADDLFRVSTMGFRGEALASISEVSEFLLRSRTADADAGAELRILGGQQSPVSPCAARVGTTIEIRRLFFNTPVRRKFMRTPQTEMGHVVEAITRIALAHPHIAFALHGGSRTKLTLPAVQDIRERIASCFGGELADDLIWIQSEDDVARIHGYVVNPKHSRSNNKQQYLFLNQRHIRDRALQHALTEAYRGLLLTGRFPIAFLSIEMAPEIIDVNVHPTKLEVRFQDSGRLYSQLLGALRNRFLTTDLTAHVKSPADTGATGTDSAHAKQSDGDHASHTQVADNVQRSPVAPYIPPDPRVELDRWLQSGDAGGEPGINPSKSQGSPPFALRTDEVMRQAELALPNPPRQDKEAWLRRPDADPSRANDSGTSSTSPGQPGYPGQPVSSLEGSTGEFGSATHATTHTTHTANHRGMQVHNRYLITSSNDGIEVIDQHALHERILYEQLREKVLQQEVEKQRLLVPEPVQLTPTEAAAVLESRELLANLGIEVEDFGGDSILVSSYPAMLSNFNPGELIRQMAEQLSAGGKQPSARDLLDELLHMISCKAAIKAGDRLSPEEVESLIELRHLVQDSHHCPHGRPTTLVFTQKELDHMFQRT